MTAAAAGQSDVDLVRDATDLVRVISEHLPLKPSGREYVGVCPFHDDHKPSMRVVTHKGNAFYKCFSCGASGDCFRFVMDYHKMEFPEALRFLADRAGITLRARGERPASGDGPSRADLRRAVEYAAEFFRRTLADPDAGGDARDAVRARGIADAMVERFGIGAAPAGFSGLTSRLAAKPSAVRTACAAGLLRQRSGPGGQRAAKPGAGDCYDTFRNRLIFPICDEIGRPVAFGGRIVDPTDEPKYLNSPESPLFHKSKTLFGLHLAKRAIIERGVAIVAEGYTDVIACHQAGVENVVGTLGTALTREHAAALARLCDTVVLVFDGDEAGRRAADRAVEVFFAEPVDVRICVLPDGLDPDELLRTDDGPARFDTAVAAAVDALEYRLRRFQSELADVTALSGRQKRLERFLHEMADLGFASMQGVRKRLVVTRLADLLGVTIRDIEDAMPARSTVRRAATPAPVAAAPVSATPDASDDRAPASRPENEADAPTALVSRARLLAERELLAIVLYEPAAGVAVLGPDATGETALATDDFLDPAARAIAAAAFERLEDGSAFTMQDLLARLGGDDAARAVASQIYFEGERRCSADGDEIDAEAHLRDAIRALGDLIDREKHQTEIAAFRAADRSGTTVADAGERVSSMIEQIRLRHQRSPERSPRPDAITTGMRGDGAAVTSTESRTPSQYRSRST